MSLSHSLLFLTQHLSGSAMTRLIPMKYEDSLRGTQTSSATKPRDSEVYISFYTNDRSEERVLHQFKDAAKFVRTEVTVTKHPQWALTVTVALTQRDNG